MRPRSASAARTREALRDAVQIYAPSTVYAVGLGAMTPALAVAALALGLD
ncbi:MFS transporter, partial [Micrococcus luteus]|nr:MFS transporter [Micrococcus luteus]